MMGLLRGGAPREGAIVAQPTSSSRALRHSSSVTPGH